MRKERKEYDLSKGKRGPVVTEKGKTRITIFLDDEIIRRFRALAQKTGKGYQTLINQALKQQLAIEEPRLTATAVRKIIREELSQV
ncbi:MAG: CopG family transcriptional regulator [Acidobacteria bacterium]|nr:MAG: CopG family transcriptional regulator [Acidobacteriota bacterium]